MQRVIGLDIGSYSVKAVEIVNTFKSYDIANFYENVIPQIDEVPPDAIIPASMEQLFKENNLEADRIITAMPGQYISSRILSFNFSDAKKIETAIYAEIEDIVPFNLDQMIIDHQILGEVGGKTIALVAMTRKNFLKSFLEHLQRLEIDPKLIDIDSLSFYNLTPYICKDTEKVTAVVDIGHEKTSVCIVSNGILRMFRSINLGGKYISEFLARDMEVDFNQAQLFKHRVSQVFCENDQGQSLSEEDYAIAERITLAANTLVKELGRTLYAFKTSGEEPVSTVYLSGGTSRTRNLNRYLEDQLELEVKMNRLDETELKISPHLHDHMIIMPQSVSIGMRAVTAVKRHTQINLRRGEFAFVQDYESVLKYTSNIFKVMALALIILCASYGVKYFFYNQQINRIKDRYQKELVTAFPDLKKKYRNKNVSFDRLQRDTKKKFGGLLQSMTASTDNFIKLHATSGSLLVLKAISEKLPKDLELNVTLYQFNANDRGGGRLMLKGETNGYDAVAKTLENLKQVRVLSDVKEKSSQAKPGTDGKIIEFTFQANYEG